MSDVMLLGVLKMPYEMAMANDLSRLQFYQRVQQLVAQVEAQPPMPAAPAELLGNPKQLPTPEQPVQEPVAPTPKEQGYVPLSDDGKSVFIDGFGEVPLAYPSMQPPQPKPQPQPLTNDQCRAAFENWYSSAPDAPKEPERIYELTDESMSELTKECIWLGWQAAHGIGAKP